MIPVVVPIAILYPFTAIRSPLRWGGTQHRRVDVADETSEVANVTHPVS
jgi:hypothetical protein